METVMPPGSVEEQDLDLGALFGALFSEAGSRDPYSLFRRYRGPGTTHRFALSVLHDRRFRNRTMDPSDHAMWSSFGRWLIALDGTDHARMRALVAGPFARHLMDGYMATIDRAARTALDAMESSGRPVDLMSAYAYVIPINVICELMGVPEEDRSTLDEALKTLGAALERQNDPSWVLAGDAAVEELNAYFEPQLADRRQVPRGDLLSAIASDEDLPFETVVANALFLIVAGHETTMATIGSCVSMLLQRSDLLAMVRQRSELIPSAIEETLRYESPVQITERTAMADVEVDGFAFEPGDYVPLFIGAANRDPAVFADPDRFDITRDPNPHLAFTAGPHFCLGAPLARMEAQRAVSALLDRFPTLTLAGDPEWHGSMPVRSLATLPITWS